MATVAMRATLRAQKALGAKMGAGEALSRGRLAACEAARGPGERTIESVNRYPGGRMKQVPCYKRVVYQFGPWDGRVEVEFRKLSKDRPAPGFSHQVAINGGNLYWLSEEFRPSVKTARFFYDKYMTGQAAKEHVA